jgi:hypothetical protein
MPVFARTKLLIHDDCLAPAPGSFLPGYGTITLNYTGPNPQRLYEKIKEIFFTVVKHDPTELQERDFYWDRSSEVEKFKVTFDLVKDMDRFSFVQIIITLSGEAKPSKEFGKEGKATVEIEGRLRTEYPQDTIWQRSFFYELFRVFYHRVIYEEKRNQFKVQCKDWIYKIQDELKSFLNILPSLK